LVGFTFAGLVFGMSKHKIKRPSQLDFVRDPGLMRAEYAAGQRVEIICRVTQQPSKGFRGGFLQFQQGALPAWRRVPGKDRIEFQGPVILESSRPDPNNRKMTLLRVQDTTARYELKVPTVTVPFIQLALTDTDSALA